MTCTEEDKNSWEENYSWAAKVLLSVSGSYDTDYEIMPTQWFIVEKAYLNRLPVGA